MKLKPCEDSNILKRTVLMMPGYKRIFLSASEVQYQQDLKFIEQLDRIVDMPEAQVVISKFADKY